jgi:hypothetical protein
MFLQRIPLSVVPLHCMEPVFDAPSLLKPFVFAVRVSIAQDFRSALASINGRARGDRRIQPEVICALHGLGAGLRSCQQIGHPGCLLVSFIIAQSIADPVHNLVLGGRRTRYEVVRCTCTQCREDENQLDHGCLQAVENSFTGTGIKNCETRSLSPYCGAATRCCTLCTGQRLDMSRSSFNR